MSGFRRGVSPLARAPPPSDQPQQQPSPLRAPAAPQSAPAGDAPRGSRVLRRIATFTVPSGISGLPDLLSDGLEGGLPLGAILLFEAGGESGALPPSEPGHTHAGPEVQSGPEAAAGLLARGLLARGIPDRHALAFAGAGARATLASLPTTYDPTPDAAAAGAASAAAAADDASLKIAWRYRGQRGDPQVSDAQALPGAGVLEVNFQSRIERADLRACANVFAFEGGAAGGAARSFHLAPDAEGDDSSLFVPSSPPPKPAGPSPPGGDLGDLLAWCATILRQFEFQTQMKEHGAIDRLQVLRMWIDLAPFCGGASRAADATEVAAFLWRLRALARRALVLLTVTLPAWLGEGAHAAGDADFDDDDAAEAALVAARRACGRGIRLVTLPAGSPLHPAPGHGSRAWLLTTTLSTTAGTLERTPGAGVGLWTMRLSRRRALVERAREAPALPGGAGAPEIIGRTAGPGPGAGAGCSTSQSGPGSGQSDLSW
ncbi:hypothetical protein H696_04964 [Fonticula alba]|uniref:Elongator complex protein 4 n=1 Tax=Fonticula alba TaxID=691883 RepID=A0A058Z418_FONAL|nr:hypothetical protein H696_04964 [Fonticula alba]KCV68673.1 hypothetical protein H696_04964 [Fonticula alba]|eukprot:XP_009497105.1 hypothetical protein H696_04964 [Fonticula alba]